MESQQNIFALVIDDDCDQYDLIKTILTHHGYSVLTADSAQQGLELFDRYHPFVIITDFSMPDMDGGELIEHLRSEGGEDVPVVIVSAHSPDYVRDHLQPNYHPDAILPKPLDFGQLLDTVGLFYQRQYGLRACYAT